MKSKGKENSANESSLELKYCERCGGLWLRPAGGGQVYCVACARAMGELPPASYPRKSPGSARMPLGPRWRVNNSDDERYGEYGDFDLDAAEGGALEALWIRMEPTRLIRAHTTPANRV